MNQPTKAPVSGLDPNKTIWQRLNEQLLIALEGNQATANQVTAQLHPYVLAERTEALGATPIPTKKA